MAVIPYVTEINFSSPRWNRDAWARMQADMDSEKERICHCSGTIMAVRVVGISQVNYLEEVERALVVQRAKDLLSGASALIP